MNSKKKIWVTLSSLCLVLTLMVVGVWAAVTQTVGLTTSVAFKSTQVSGSVQLHVTGQKTAHTAETKSFTAAQADQKGKFAITAVEFAPDATGTVADIVYTFTINNAGDGTIKAVPTVEITGLSAGDAAEFTQTTVDATAQAITKGTAGTITVTLHLTDSGISVPQAASINISLIITKNVA
ncbi:MAG: hypothetical protein RR400_02090 [Clostridia bacterium]